MKPQLDSSFQKINRLSVTYSWDFIKRNRSDIILAIVFLFITGFYFILLIKDNIPHFGLIFLGLLWLFLWIISSRLSYATPMDFPIIVLLGFLPLSLLFSVDRSLSLPKIYALIFGIGIFYVIVNIYRSHQLTFLIMAALTLLAFLIPLLGLLRADWSGSSYTLPSRILSRLGQMIPFIKNISTGGGIHVNTIGGTLTFFVPLLISMLWDEKAIKRTFFYSRKNAKALNILSKLTVLSALVFVLTILILTQSRGSFLGVTVGLLALIIWKRPKIYWLIPMLIVVTLAIFLVFADGNIYKFISLLDTSQEGDTLQTRLDYWKRTVTLIQDFPFTGVGLGTYSKVFDELYIFTTFNNEGQHSFYAHNMYLAVAASMGIPVLVIYFALFSSCVTMVVSIHNKVRSASRILLMGLSCGILANLIYGLWDNYLLGEKLAIVQWIYLGIITAIYVHQYNFQRHHSRFDMPTGDTPQRQSIKKISRHWVIYSLFGLGSWLILSLAAIAFINSNPYISLMVASLGGIGLGIIITKKTEIPTTIPQPPVLAD